MPNGSRNEFEQPLVIGEEKTLIAGERAGREDKGRERKEKRNKTRMECSSQSSISNLPGLACSVPFFQPPALPTNAHKYMHDTTPPHIPDRAHTTQPSPQHHRIR
jgi:hypothetical protein